MTVTSTCSAASADSLAATWSPPNPAPSTSTRSLATIASSPSPWQRGPAGCVSCGTLRTRQHDRTALVVAEDVVAFHAIGLPSVREVRTEDRVDLVLDL